MMFRHGRSNPECDRERTSSVFQRYRRLMTTAYRLNESSQLSLQRFFGLHLGPEKRYAGYRESTGSCGRSGQCFGTNFASNDRRVHADGEDILFCVVD